MTKGSSTLFILVAVGLFTLATILVPKINIAPESESFGSVVQGNEYLATTTCPNSTLCGNTANSVRLLKTGYGAVGQITITGAGAGELSLYNATTSNVSARAADKATSTIAIALAPASAAANTYVFDAVFTDGLLLVVGATAPTSTITWR